MCLEVGGVGHTAEEEDGTGEDADGGQARHRWRRLAGRSQVEGILKMVTTIKSMRQENDEECADLIKSGKK